MPGGVGGAQPEWLTPIPIARSTFDPPAKTPGKPGVRH
jgi:hypothetical protein